MRKYSAGKQWEDLNRKRQEAENEELEARRTAANQAVRAQVAGLPSLTSWNATLSVGRPQYYQDRGSRFYRSQKDATELEAQDDPPPQYQQQASLTPPASDGDAPEVDNNEQIRYLQREVVQKESRIKRLESEVEVEKGKRRRLQAERHEAVDAQRRAEAELCLLRSQVANLDQLLDGSIKRQKELESELDICRQEARELKWQLHEERCSHESDIRAQETRETQIRHRFEDTNRAPENQIGRGRRPDPDVGSILEDTVQSEDSPQRDFASRQGQSNTFSTDAPSRSRRQDRGTAGRAYVSIPKNGNRRAVWIFG